jgi:hypothetical protein
MLTILDRGLDLAFPSGSERLSFHDLHRHPRHLHQTQFNGVAPRRVARRDLQTFTDWLLLLRCFLFVPPMKNGVPDSDRYWINREWSQNVTSFTDTLAKLMGVDLEKLAGQLSCLARSTDRSDQAFIEALERLDFQAAAHQAAEQHRPVLLQFIAIVMAFRLQLAGRYLAARNYSMLRNAKGGVLPVEFPVATPATSAGEQEEEYQPFDLTTEAEVGGTGSQDDRWTEIQIQAGTVYPALERMAQLPEQYLRKGCGVPGPGQNMRSLNGKWLESFGAVEPEIFEHINNRGFIPVSLQKRARDALDRLRPLATVMIRGSEKFHTALSFIKQLDYTATFFTDCEVAGIQPVSLANVPPQQSLEAMFRNRAYFETRYGGVSQYALLLAVALEAIRLGKLLSGMSGSDTAIPTILNFTRPDRRYCVWGRLPDLEGLFGEATDAELSDAARLLKLLAPLCGLGSLAPRNQERHFALARLFLRINYHQRGWCRSPQSVLVPCAAYRNGRMKVLYGEFGILGHLVR